MAIIVAVFKSIVIPFFLCTLIRAIPLQYISSIGKPSGILFLTGFVESTANRNPSALSVSFSNRCCHPDMSR
jgi:hypothetical protein